MFLKEVYRHSKWMFAGMLFFALLQLGINAKRGMVFSPFFHYGMYSFPQKPSTQSDISVIQVNGDTLRGKDYTPYQWDKIFYTLQQVRGSDCDHNFYENQIKRLYQKAGLSKPDKNQFVNDGNNAQKMEKYKIWLSNQLEVSADSIYISIACYRYLYKTFELLPNANPQPMKGYLCN